MGDDDGSTEQALLDRVDASTNSKDLADQLLELHRASQLSKPLLGQLHSTLHVFRRDPTDTTHVVTSFSAKVLPAPQDPRTEPAAFDLTMRDLFGDSAIPPLLDPTASISFSVERLRGAIARQIPKMERHRAIARAEDVLKAMGFAEERMTYAALKRNRLLVELWD